MCAHGTVYSVHYVACKYWYTVKISSPWRSNLVLHPACDTLSSCQQLGVVSLSCQTSNTLYLNLLVHCIPSVSTNTDTLLVCGCSFMSCLDSWNCISTLVCNIQVRYIYIYQWLRNEVKILLLYIVMDAIHLGSIINRVYIQPKE